METLEKKRVNMSLDLFKDFIRVSFKDGLIYGLNTGLGKNTKSKEEEEDALVERVVNEIQTLLEY